MKLKTRYTDEELEARQHEVLRDGEKYWVHRYEVTFSEREEKEAACVILELRSKSGKVKVLKFSGTEFDVFSPMGVLGTNERGPIYLMHKLNDGYEEGRALEVGCINGDVAPYFWASHVEKIS
jgi:hypothetical protein